MFHESGSTLTDEQGQYQRRMGLPPSDRFVTMER